MRLNEKGIVYKGKLSSKSFLGESDHPEYMSYLNEDHGKTVGVSQGEIMDVWSKGIIISRGFATCFPIIAIDQEGQFQVIHFSKDPWRKTNLGDYNRKVEEWKKLGCDIVLMRAKDSAVEEIDQKLREIFGDRFAEIDFGVDSRFGIVIDAKKRIALVQFTDAKELRKYQI